ncbi:hypothetical protein HCN44_001274 [Aphidius gifuensis]|uniref:Uncharacterized protein n=1 Tax=Aphidius gifuensis TaxID=684658 RepID=A0A834XMG0_APHGI|nr:uncharacterized protein LOC122857000 [Aphidius gifuensis]KAF7988701.1 hypothetical protein HCN44_001274 [Aphidius gifuensis]
MEPWITRNEINKRTQLPVDDEPGKFIKKKPSSTNSIRPRPRIPLPKNPQIFEEIKYSSEYDSDWQPNFDEITADIQALNGGPLCTDAMLVNEWKQKLNNSTENKDDDNKNNNVDDILIINNDVDDKRKNKKKRSSRRRNRPLFSNNVLMRNLVQKDQTRHENIVEIKMKNLKV